jgi:hypothetical protein
MPERARRIASRLRHFINDRRHAKRRSARLPLTVSLAASRVNPNGFRRQTTLEGNTLDISATGLSFIVPAIRIGEHYLTGQDRRLRLKIDLPHGPIEMQVAPVRYESLDDQEAERGYVVGVIIVEMSETHRAAFDDYLKELVKGGRSH